MRISMIIQLLSFVLLALYLQSCSETNSKGSDDFSTTDSLFTTIETIAIDTDCVQRRMPDVDKSVYLPVVESENRIEYFENDGKDLFSFFCKLGKAKDKGKVVRLMHFGDSQVLRDRGTKKLRSLLHQHYSGVGPGLQTVGRYYGGYEHRSLKCEHSKNWEFYDSFLFPDKTVPHSKYGMMSIFSRYAEITDTIPQRREAWVEYTPSQFANPDVLNWNHLRMFYENSDPNLVLRIFQNEILLDTFTLGETNGAEMFDYQYSQFVDHLRIEFCSLLSPDFYGIALDGDAGLMVDNIGLCGSAGTFFTKIDTGAQILMFKELETGLIVLQFGGNTVPLTKSQAAVDRYARLMKNQILHIQSVLPGIPIVVIGPSDMLYQSSEDSTRWVSYSKVDDVVDGMRKSCSETGAYYWDLFRIMGGKGGMNTWYRKGFVNSDRIHFNTKGINYAMELFYEALMKTSPEKLLEKEL